MMFPLAAFVISTVLFLCSCGSNEGISLDPPLPTSLATVSPAGTNPKMIPSPSLRTPTPLPTSIPSATVRGQIVSSTDGTPVGGARVRIRGTEVVTGIDGNFSVADVPVGSEVSVDRPVWQSAKVRFVDINEPLVITLEPVVVRGLRVSQQVAGDQAAFAELLDLATNSVVNALVFDTKDETDSVLYHSEVPFVEEIGSSNPVYNPVDLLSQVRQHGLYAVTRIVTFKDSIWSSKAPEAKLAGTWVNAADPRNWDYPLDLAVEACEIGFDEVQFDYVRFPAGELGGRAAHLVPGTEADRTEAISGFLNEARLRLHPRGCGVSAAIFGIVMSSQGDERLGQTPETVSQVVDAVSPMLYPSHYSSGWLGFADPNDHPGPVVAHALDTGAERISLTSLMRPWIQGFFYNGTQVRAQIAEAEARGAGWIIWNFFGEYNRDWLPPKTDTQ